MGIRYKTAAILAGILASTLPLTAVIAETQVSKDAIAKAEAGVGKSRRLAQLT